MLRLRTILQYNSLYYIILIVVFILAIFRIYILKYESKYQENDNAFIGIIADLKKEESQYKITLKAKEKIIIYYYSDEDLNLKKGMKLNVEGDLYYPINNTIPNTFNYKKYLNNHKIYFLMKARSITVLDESTNFIYSIKNSLYKKIGSYDYTKQYLNTFVLGDTSLIEEDILKSYQLTGIIHLFSISGSQINLISLGIILLLKKVKIKEVFKYLIVILFLILYCLIINSSASIYRSLIFFIILSINKLYDLNITTKNILFLTISSILIYNPLTMFDIGFQYSVLVTYGLIISSRKNKQNYIRSLLYTSFIASLFSMPITLMNYYEINIISVLSNLIFVPIVTFIIFPLSIATLITPIFQPLLYFSTEIMENINIIISKIKIFNVVIPKVNIIFYLMYYILIIIYIYSHNKKYLLLSLFLVMSFKLKPFLCSKTFIYFLDVGQGDSTLIYNRKEVILIDTGGLYNYDVSNNTIIFLKSLGLTKIDLLLLTHGDSDHMKDSMNIIKNISVKTVMINLNERNELEQNLINNIKVITNYQSKLNLKIYNQYIGNDENSSSIISLLTVSNYQVLFMGDSPKSEEMLFLKDNPNIYIDIIKLGHHGSKTSSDYNFLKSIKAKEAIISSGRNNRFNHPSPETLETLNLLNIKYYDTKESGTICYIFGRNNYTKKTYLP